MVKYGSIESVNLVHDIIEMFEDFLDSKGIEIQNDEKSESENPAPLYGTDYGWFEDEISLILCKYGLMKMEWEDD